MRSPVYHSRRRRVSGFHVGAGYYNCTIWLLLLGGCVEDQDLRIRDTGYLHVTDNGHVEWLPQFALCVYTCFPYSVSQAVRKRSLGSLFDKGTQPFQPPISSLINKTLPGFPCEFQHRLASPPWIAAHWQPTGPHEQMGQHGWLPERQAWNACLIGLGRPAEP